VRVFVLGVWYKKGFVINYRSTKHSFSRLEKVPNIISVALPNGPKFRFGETIFVHQSLCHHIQRFQI